MLYTDISELKKELLNLLIKKSLKLAPPDKPFILTSGMTSNHYIDGKKTTSDPEGLYLIARIFLHEIEHDNIQAIGGPTLGADTMIGAMSTLSYMMGSPVPLFIVRKEVKKHGTQSLIEGPEIRGQRVVIVEDVITTGGSVLKAVDAVRDQNCEVVKILALVDREQGGRGNFLKENISYHPIFTISELLPAEYRKL